MVRLARVWREPIRWLWSSGMTVDSGDGCPGGRLLKNDHRRQGDTGYAHGDIEGVLWPHEVP
jgi:hypothetical protein